MDSNESFISEEHKPKAISLFSWLLHYNKEWLKYDILAGSITAAVVIPKAMAYATIAGLPVQVGIYTALVPMIIYAFFGTSRPLSVSTTTTLAILTAAQLEKLVPDGNSALLISTGVTLTLMVGLALILAYVLRLGFIANFISEPVLVGFKAGIGLVIVLDQIPKLLGVHFTKGSFIHNLMAIIKALPETIMATFIVGLTMIVLLVGLNKFFPKAPAPLIAVALGIAGMGLFQLQNYGVESIGHIPGGLPSLTLPNLSQIEQLWPGAIGIALMSFTETIAAGRAFSKSEEPMIHPNMELLATGLANVGSSLFGAMPSGGGTSQTAVNRMAGAKTQLAALTTASFSLLTMLLLAPLLGLMPQATLAAIVIIYSIGLIKLADFRAILDIRRTEFIWAVVAFVGVVLLGTLQGIIVAIIVSLVALAQQLVNPPIRVLGRKPGTNVFRQLSKEHPDDEVFPGLLILRLERRIFFINAANIGEKIRTMLGKFKPKVLVLDFSGVTDLEYTALKMLIQGEKRLSNEGVTVWFVGMNPEVFDMINRSSLGKTIGRERMHFNLELAVKKYMELENN